MARSEIPWHYHHLPWLSPYIKHRLIFYIHEDYNTAGSDSFRLEEKHKTERQSSFSVQKYIPTHISAFYPLFSKENFGASDDLNSFIYRSSHFLSAPSPSQQQPVLCNMIYMAHSRVTPMTTINLLHHQSQLKSSSPLNCKLQTP
jgi:hypothetical protein